MDSSSLHSSQKEWNKLSKRIKRKAFQIPKIQHLSLKLEWFKCVASLDLNMEYYHIKLYPFSRKLCTEVLPWGKNEYQELSMGPYNRQDVFQEKMNELFNGQKYVIT